MYKLFHQQTKTELEPLLALAAPPAPIVAGIEPHAFKFENCLKPPAPPPPLEPPPPPATTAASIILVPGCNDIQPVDVFL